MKKPSLRSWKTLRTSGRDRGRALVRCVGLVREQSGRRGPGRDHDRLQGRIRLRLRADIGGARLPSRKYAGGKASNPNKPSAGMTGITAGGKQIKIVGYGCGNDTVPPAVTETKRLMEQLNADVMIGPLSGDEAVSVANYAKSHPDEDVHHRHGGLAGSDPADRAEERVPLPR